MTFLRPIILRTGLFILLCLCWPAAVPAQPFLIGGTVKTPGGQPIAGANIWFTYHGSGINNGTVGGSCISNAAGNYGNVIPYLVFMPQQYDIFLKIEKAGYDFRPLAVDAYGNPLNVPGYYIPKNSQPWGNITGKNFTGVPLQPMTSGMSSSQSSPDAGWSYFSIQVPPGATQLDVNYDGTTDNALVPKLDSWPDVLPGSGSQPRSAGFTKSLTLNASSTPPLSPGKWYIGVHSTEATSFTLTTTLLSADPLPVISGKVTHFDGVTTTPLAGMSVKANNGATTGVTDALGQYQVTVPYYWSGEISVAQPANARFLPVSRTYSGMTANQADQSFSGPQYYLNVVSDKGDPQGTGWYDAGTTTSWSVTNPFAGSAGVRYVTTTPSSGVVDMTGPQTITVDWKTQYFLKTSVTPPGAGSINPTSIWYYAGSEGRVSALPAADWNFSHFTGGLTGSATPQNLIMDQPREVIAHFVPTTPPTSIPGRILVPLEKSTIQSAINAAVTGDEIIVSEGTYRESIRFLGKNITVRSTAPTNPNVVAATIIDGTTTTLTSVVTFSGAEPASATLSGFTITNGKGYYGGGINGNPTQAVNGTHATISYNQITENTNSSEGAGIYDCDGAIRNNMIYGNTASEYGGGLAWCDGTIEACTVFNNTASNGAGFFACDSAQINNCIVYENSGVIGGGFYFSDSTPAPLTGSVTNCVIYKNHSTTDWGSGYGGGVYCWGGKVALKNCIIWGNTGNLAPADPLYTRQVYHGNVAYVFYSCIQDWESTDKGCIAADPQFVNPQQYNFQLAPGSPCIDTGTSVSLSKDIRGAPRPFDGDGQGAGGTGDGNDFDMGAYEYGAMAAPGTPVMIAEPLLTGGTTNTVSWETVTGAAAYTIQCAGSADFATPLYSIYLPAATDGPTTLSATFTGLFDTTYWYRVRAENAYGGPGQWSQSTSSTQDGTAPGFDHLAANPPQATAQALVSIIFRTSEPLAADPEVSVNGNPASLVSHAGNQYTYTYIMLLADPLGPATISISGTDGMGYHSSISDSSALSRVIRTGAGDWTLYQ
jgi:hypothetical protein